MLAPLVTLVSQTPVFDRDFTPVSPRLYDSAQASDDRKAGDQKETETAQTALRYELARVAEECCLAGWDGYGAAPVTYPTFKRAFELSENFPDSLPIPTVGAEPDGSLTYDWYRNPSYVLSLSVAPDGRIYYAANVGARRRSGADVFTGKLPSEVVDLIPEILPA